MILELKDICKDYLQGKMVIPVLKHIDFQMEQGEYVAIMGPSGSGKTTLMNIVGCLDQATSGQLFLDGQDISKCTENEMSDLRLKRLGLFPELSAVVETDCIGKCGTATDLCGSCEKRAEGTGTAGTDPCRTGRQSEFSAESAFRWAKTESSDCQSTG